MSEPDPAAVGLTVTVTGLSPSEAAAVLLVVPVGATLTSKARPPQIGPLTARHDVAVTGLSTKGAHDVVTGLMDHFEKLGEPNPPAGAAA